MKDHCLTVWEIADQVGTSRGSANTILTEDFGMRRVEAKFVRKLLLLEQQQQHRTCWSAPTGIVTSSRL
jgi:hypothetical protein